MELNATLATQEFHFGLETELLIRSKENFHRNWNDCATEVGQRLEYAGVKNHVSGYGYQQNETWTEWVVTEEYGISNEPDNNRWGIEIVSPKLNFADYDDWSSQIDLVWLNLSTNFYIDPSLQCSTQVHIAPTNKWKVEQLKNVAKAVVYFERSIDQLVPEDRRMNHWCRSNRYNGTLKELSMTDIFKAVDNCDSRDELELLLCAVSFGLGVTVDRRFRWNFRNLTETIEFRQPPRSVTSKDGKTWIEFTVSFVQGALEAAGSLDPLNDASLPSLKSVVFDGARRSGIKDFSRLEELFERKDDTPSENFDWKEFVKQEEMYDEPWQETGHPELATPDSEEDEYLW